MRNIFGAPKTSAQLSNIGGGSIETGGGGMLEGLKTIVENSYATGLLKAEQEKAEKENSISKKKLEALESTKEEESENSEKDSDPDDLDPDD